MLQGFSQLPGLDFDETFVPIVKLTSIHVLYVLAVHLQLHFHHLDVDTAFLNGELDEKIYMRLLQGIGADSGKIVHLKKSLYGLKQASCVQNLLLDKVLGQMGFHRIHADFCIYLYHKDGHICFVAIYVDDIGVLCNDLVFMG